MSSHAEEIERYRAQTPRSRELYERSQRVFPLGVSGNFRMFPPYPIFVERAAGSRLWDRDGREYVDYSMCFGAAMVGHSHPAIVEALLEAAPHGFLYGLPHEREVRAAEIVSKRFAVEQVRFTNSGTEATMHALRVARAFTGRSRFIKFEGAYHGGHDPVLVSVKPARARVGHPRHPRPEPMGGVPAGASGDTVVARWNDADSVRELLERHENQVAALLFEPVMLNVGCIPPRDGFLEELRALADEFGCLLIFDEVKTGAKLAWGGAQERYGVRADIVCLAKAVGGGLPLGAVGARREIMDEIAAFRSFHGGTYASNPLATTACTVALEKVLTKELYPKLHGYGAALAEGCNRIIRERGRPWCAVNEGVNGTVFWRETPPRNYREWLDQDFAAFDRYWHTMLNRGVIPQAPGSDEQWTVSALHGEADVERFLAAFEEFAR